MMFAVIALGFLIGAALPVWAVGAVILLSNRASVWVSLLWPFVVFWELATGIEE